MTPTVSVVVLSYNRPDYLRESLASVAAQSLRPAEVIVVDNHSDRSAAVAAVVAGFAGMRLIAHPDNRGFTGGMNAGLAAAAAGEYVVLSEDDIVLDPGAVAAVVGHMAAHPEVGVAGGLMLNRADGTVRCAGGRVTLGTRFRLDVIGAGAADDGRFADPFPVTYLPGAFLAARRDVWGRLGGFRDRYFLYMEDVDLCLRAAAAGYRLDVVPAARVWHADPPAGGRVPGWLARLKARNLLRLYLLNAPARVLPGFLARYAGWAPVRDAARGRWDALAAAARTAVELPALARERWAAPAAGGARG